VRLPQLNSIILSGFEGAQSVRGANPPRTRPTPVAAPVRPVWKPKRTGRTSTAHEASGAPSTPGTDKEPDA
jgi:small conductance mechanosensitive channel